MHASSTLLVLTLATAAYGSPSARIVSGSTAYEGQIPYQVAVSNIKNDSMLYDYWCSGSILNEQYILTAAKCIFGFQPTDIRVMYGFTNISDPNATWVETEKLIPHLLYNTSVYNFNIGLIKLKENIVFGPKVKAIKLPTSDNLDSTYSAVASGWGVLHPYYLIFPTNLQYIKLNVISHNECITMQSKATRSHMCTISDLGKGVCIGDTGGPLVANGVQVGIVGSKNMFGYSCGESSSDVFTRVYQYLDWIEENSKF